MDTRKQRCITRLETLRRTISKPLLFGAVTSLSFSLASGFPSANSSCAQEPARGAIFEPANRVARFLGIGYSDGYHASKSRSNCPIYDLPPASSYRASQYYQNHGQALFSMPASAYTFSPPSWVESQGVHQVPPSVPQYSAPMGTGVTTYPVQPTPVPNPATNYYAPQPQLTQPVAPAWPKAGPNNGGFSPSTLDDSNVEDLPAPPAMNQPTSPSDLLPNDPPSGKFFDEDQTQKLLEGLDSLGDEPLGDPLSVDPNSDTVPSRREGFESKSPSLNDDSLELDLDDFSLPPAEGDDALLNSRLQGNPYYPLTRSHSNVGEGAPAAIGRPPGQVVEPQLNPPYLQSRNQVPLPATTKPAISRAPVRTEPNLPRTAGFIYEPRR